MDKNKIINLSLTILIFILLFTFAIFLNSKCAKGIDKNKAFRTSDIANTEPLWLDNEAMVLSESTSDTGLRMVALEANNLVNDIRAGAGLNELTWDNNLESVANVRANEISQSFSHTRPNGKQWYTVNSKIQGGENLAYGFDNAEDVVEAWMNSPTHRDNILYDEFDKVAISIYEEDGTYYIAQELGY